MINTNVIGARWVVITDDHCSDIALNTCSRSRNNSADTADGNSGVLTARAYNTGDIIDIRCVHFKLRCIRRNKLDDVTG
jgi:hypothetical protein